MGIQKKAELALRISAVNIKSQMYPVTHLDKNIFFRPDPVDRLGRIKISIYREEDKVNQFVSPASMHPSHNGLGRAWGENVSVSACSSNAGIVYDAAGPAARKLFAESVSDDWRRDIDLIVYGTLNCIKAVIGHMIERRSGRIVNISSDQGRANTGLKGLSIYATSKGGVIALTRNIAAEVASYGITVNSVCPGLVRTTRALVAEKQRETRPKEYEYYKNIEKSVVATIPLGRMGEPDDIAKLAVFLASDAASWITGQCCVVNGGQMMV